MSPLFVIALLLVTLLATTGSIFVVLVRARRARLAGLVEVQGVTVHVDRGLTIKVTFDYPVRGGWLRATRLWDKGQWGMVFGVPRPGQAVRVLVDPDDPARAPEFPGLGVDGSFAVTTGIVSGLLVVAVVVLTVLAVVL